MRAARKFHKVAGMLYQLAGGESRKPPEITLTQQDLKDDYSIHQLTFSLAQS